jgi:hypothetical protein
MTNTRKRFIIRPPFLKRIRRAAATGFAAAATGAVSISAGGSGRKRRARISCRRLLPLVAACALACFPGIAAGQEANPEALRVFLDCATCDFDYLRTEMTYVNYVRDRKDAEVHVLVTTQPTGGGGTEFTIDFIGLRQFAGATERLRYVAATTDTAEEGRRAFARRLQLVLARYVAATQFADDLTVVHRPVAGRRTAGRPEDDPWNFWLLRTRISGSLNTEQSISARSFFGSFSGERTTEDWKIRIGTNGSYNSSRFALGDGGRFSNTTRSFDVTGLVVGSLGTNWAWGIGGSATASTFVNQDLTLRIAPAVEYNIFPYAESTRRQLTFSYAIGANGFHYEEETLFGRTSETLIDQTVTVSFDMKQPWGQTGLALEAANFLRDAAKHRVVLAGTLDFRIVRGLSLTVSGSASRIRDQLFLPARGLTTEEILVQRRQLATDYRFNLALGVSLTFGSIYNNVVNSRFAGSSGGIIRTF